MAYLRRGPDKPLRARPGSAQPRSTSHHFGCKAHPGPRITKPGLSPPIGGNATTGDFKQDLGLRPLRLQPAYGEHDDHPATRLHLSAATRGTCVRLRCRAVEIVPLGHIERVSRELAIVEHALGAAGLDDELDGALA